MSCLSLAFWEDVVVRFIILIAVTALLRVLIAWFAGGAGPTVWWPPVRAPWTAGATPQGGAGILAAVLEILIWVAWTLFFVYLVFALIACLLGAGGAWHFFPRY